MSYLFIQFECDDRMHVCVYVCVCYVVNKLLFSRFCQKNEMLSLHIHLTSYCIGLASF